MLQEMQTHLYIDSCRTLLRFKLAHAPFEVLGLLSLKGVFPPLNVCLHLDNERFGV